MKRLSLSLLLLIVLAQLVIPAYAAPMRDTTYVVQRGDTLYRIAIRYNVSMAAIVSANRLTNANYIFVGQRLIIPGVGSSVPVSGTTTYTVQRGDSLYGIALRYGISYSAIVAANGIANPNLIFVGQRLTIPGSSSGTSPIPVTGAPPPPKPTSVPQAPSVPASGTSGSFELGGQVAAFSRPDLMKYAGMVWVKQQARWVPGAKATDFAGVINNAHAQGFKILLSVLGDPGHIAGGANYADLASFMGGLAGLGADVIEVWNDMNIDREWPAGQISGATYTEMLRQSYNAIKGRNANTLVISGALAPTGAEGAFGLDHVWNDNRYIGSMAAAGAANYMDCIGAHYNEGIVSPSTRSGDPRSEYYTRYFWGMVDTYYNAFGGKKKVCFTELGYLTDDGYASVGSVAPSFAWADPTSVSQQAAWLAEATSLSASSGKVRLLIVFNVDLTNYGADPQAGYAIIRPGGSCPACDSLRTVTGGR